MVKPQISRDLARFSLLESERKTVSIVVGMHTDEVPTEVQSALLLLRESNASDTAISLLGLGS